MREPYEDWDDYCDKLEDTCPDCKEHEETMDVAQEAMIKLIAQLYGKDQLNCIKLHNELDVLCDLIKLDSRHYPKHWPTVRRVGDLPEVHNSKKEKI